MVTPCATRRRGHFAWACVDEGVRRRDLACAPVVRARSRIRRERVATTLSGPEFVLTLGPSSTRAPRAVARRTAAPKSLVSNHRSTPCPGGAASGSVRLGMLLRIPGVQLHHELAVAEQPLVFSAFVAACQVQELSVPTAARLHVANRTQRLGLDGAVRPGVPPQSGRHRALLMSHLTASPGRHRHGAVAHCEGPRGKD
jgi:hypothetical protein